MGRAYLYARYHNVQNQVRGVKGWNFGALAVGAVEMARVYLYTGAFLLGGPPACWENGSRIYLYVRYPFVALAVGRVEILGR